MLHVVRICVLLVKMLTPILVTLCVHCDLHIIVSCHLRLPLLRLTHTHTHTLQMILSLSSSLTALLQLKLIANIFVHLILPWSACLRLVCRGWSTHPLQLGASVLCSVTRVGRFSQNTHRKTPTKMSGVDLAWNEITCGDLHFALIFRRAHKHTSECLPPQIHKSHVNTTRSRSHWLQPVQYSYHRHQ